MHVQPINIASPAPDMQILRTSMRSFLILGILTSNTRHPPSQSLVMTLNGTIIPGPWRTTLTPKTYRNGHHKCLTTSPI